jgi:Protein phosphatase 2C
LRVRVCSLWLPKAGNQPHEYEDAVWPARSTTRKVRTLRCAVADGATEASFSGLWAAMLVRAFGRGRIRAGRFVDALVPLQSAWWSEVSRKPLPWYAEEKLRSGAFSSLLGLTLTEPGGDGAVSWTAVAVGDSCLFVVRAGELITSFPIQSSDCFDNSPYLISSSPVHNGALGAVLRRDSGRIQTGDSLYLLTDALACWFLAGCERGDHPWVTLERLSGGSRESFAEWVAGERRKLRIHNDDVTMLHVRLE